MGEDIILSQVNSREVPTSYKLWARTPQGKTSSMNVIHPSSCWKTTFDTSTNIRVCAYLTGAVSKRMIRQDVTLSRRDQGYASSDHLNHEEHQCGQHNEKSRVSHFPIYPPTSINNPLKTSTDPPSIPLKDKDDKQKRKNSWNGGVWSRKREIRWI